MRRKNELLSLLAGVLAAGISFVGSAGCDTATGLPDIPSASEPTPTPASLNESETTATPDAGPTPDPSATPAPPPEPTPTPSPAPTATPTPVPGPTPFPSLSCAIDNDCDDGVFCNGQERCVKLQCAPGADPCQLAFEGCDEEAASCTPILERCQSDDNCAADEVCDTTTGLCQPVVTPNCGPGAGNCFVANFSPGCESQSCCDTVCQLEPMCCFLEWDAGCAVSALTFCQLEP